MSRRRNPWAQPLACLALALGTAVSAAAQDPNVCDEPGEAPDVIVGDIDDVRRWGAEGDLTAFSIGTVACSVGTCWVSWSSETNLHPVVGQNMFRLRDGRFEQLGQSWLKHGSFAVPETLCSPDCIEPDSDGFLGVNCSDPYNSGLNGTQRRLGPKFEVNPVTGEHPHPYTAQDQTGPVLYKRIQVHADDLNPALNAGALYFVEAQYVTEDDHQAGNSANNASYRQVEAFEIGAGEYDVDVNPAWVTQLERPALQAWQDTDPSVVLTIVDVPMDGRFLLAAQATDLGGGTWHYEYAVQNFNSHRSARSFEVPVPLVAVITNTEFHDVDYHSGEPHDGTDWPADVGVPGLVTWQTQTFAENENANALRWGTVYNFRFDCDAPPRSGDVSLQLFRDGDPSFITATLVIPDPCDENGTCDPGENCLNCPDDCPGMGPDADSDGMNLCEDCDDSDGTSWSTPGEVEQVLVNAVGRGTAMLEWTAPRDPGGPMGLHEVVRSEDPSDFVSSMSCLTLGDPRDLQATDATSPPGGLWCYLVRAVNACADGTGPVGRDSLMRDRMAGPCP